MKISLAMWFFVLGSVLASHAGLIAWRLPKGENVLTGRSRCENCGRPLSFTELLPVFGWLVVRGRCRTCGYHVPIIYPLTEIFTGIFAAAIFWRYGPAPAFQWMLALFFCLCAALIDAREMIIPDRLSVAAAVAGLAAGGLAVGPVGSLEGGMLCGGLMLLLSLLSRGGIGGGDVKFCAALGLFLGPQAGILTLVCAYVLGGIWAAGRVLIRRAHLKRQVPFAPWLLAGAVLAITVSLLK